MGVAGYGTYLNGSFVGTTSQTTYSFDGLSCGTTYTLGVDTYDAAGNRSAIATLTASTSGCADAIAPTVPSNLLETGATATSISLSWSPSLDNVGIVGYDIYRNSVVVGTTALTVYTVTGLTCGTSYTIGVDSYDAAGNRSAQTSVVAPTSPCPDQTPPTSPTNLTKTGVTQTSISVSWTASTDNVGVAGYDLYQNSNKAATVTATNYTFPGLTCGTSYALAVVAFDAAGNRSPQVSLSMPTSACSGATAVALPIAPQDYSLPGGAVSVATSQQLVSALASPTTQDIVLANGTYTTVGTTSPTPYFQVTHGDRLWAQNRGQAILRAGLVFGGNFGASGGEVHGLAFNISNPALTQNSAALYTWGPDGVGTKVYDSTFEGNGAIRSAIDFYAVKGNVIQRIIASHFLDYGIHVTQNSQSSTAEASTITDVDVSYIRESTPGSSNGTAEFGIWIGTQVANPVVRLRAEHCWFGGLWTGAASNNTTFSDITVSTVDSSTGVAVYNEHNTVHDTFKNFNLGPNIYIGFNCEWNYGSGFGACQYSTFENGTIDSHRTGVFLDEGQVGNTVQYVKFVHQTCAAIVDNQGTNNVYLNNDYRGIALGALVLASYC